MLGQSVSKNSLILGAFALVTASVLAITHQGTREHIAAAERAAAQKALFEVLPENKHDNDLLNTAQPVPEELWSALGLKNGGDMYIAQQDGKPTAVIVPAIAPDGYSGDIRMIIAINADGSISGVRVLSHAETPGLGDKVELAKSDWILSFNGKSLDKPEPHDWKVKKDGGSFDQFTGATITPRAVVRQVKNALTLFKENHGMLLRMSGKEQEYPQEQQTDAPQVQATQKATES